MADGEIENVHTVEIGLVHAVLAARDLGIRLVDGLRDRVNDMVKDAHGRNIVGAADILELAPEVFLRDGEDHDPPVLADGFLDGLEMLLGAYKGPDVFDGLDRAESGKRRTRKAVCCLAGGVGNKMEVEDLLGFSHGVLRLHRAAVYNLCIYPIPPGGETARWGLSGIRGRFSTLLSACG